MASHRAIVFSLLVLAVLSLSAFTWKKKEEPSAAAVQAGRIVDSMPLYRLPPTAGDTDPVMRLSTLKPVRLHLGAEAKSASVEGDSAGMRVVIYGVKSVVLWPRRNGAAHITVRGGDGKIIMTRGVVVGDARKKYIRIAENCVKGKSCAAPRIYYCPALCFPAHLAMAGLK